MKKPLFLNDLDKESFCQELGRSFKDDPIDCLDESSLTCFKKAYFIGKTSGWEPVLITGDNGVGKTGYAKLIWSLSKNRKLRGDGNFTEVNCAALSPNLVESILFGHKKGAFTGAVSDKDGLLAHAAKNKGCIFLDEFGELSLDVQAKLLRVFQHGKILPVGANEEIDIGNLKIICATNRNLEKEIAAGKFRRDLFNRVNKYHIGVPPLKDRPKDCAFNIKCFLEKYVEKLDENDWAKSLKIDPNFYRDNLESGYPWPGNFRELQNRLYQAIVRNVINQKFTIGFYDLMTPEDVARERKIAESQSETVTPVATGLAAYGFEPLSDSMKSFDLKACLNKLESAYVEAAKEQMRTLDDAAKLLGFNCYQTMVRHLKK